MIFEEIPLKGAYIIHLEKRGDHRGYFARAWCQNEFSEHGLMKAPVQANLAASRKKGTLRGMHFQVAPYEEAKLIKCNRGRIFDAMIDLRPDSPTHLKWFGIELSEKSDLMVYIPEQFAHGYLTLEDNTEVFYQVSQFYTPEAEKGLRWDDPAFGIQWPLTDGLTISEKDRNWPLIS